jgi:hypothetical protein
MKKQSNSNRQNKVRHKMQDKLIQLSNDKILISDEDGFTSDHHEFKSDEDTLLSHDDGLRTFKRLIWGLLLSPLLWLTIIMEILVGVFVFYGY